MQESITTKIIAFANQKGGVGKTTSCVNIAAALSLCGKKILLIDLDPQGNATMGSGVNKNKQETTVNEVLLGIEKISNSIVKDLPGGYDLLPANGTLTTAEVNLINREAKEFRLQKAIAEIAEQYHYVLLDCPPSLNMLTANALVAASSVIIPMQCEYYALEGLSSLLGTIEQIKSEVNLKLEIEGIILTMYDPRNRLATDVEQQLRELFKDKVYTTPVPRNVRLAEAPSHGVPVMLYDKNSRGASAYMALAGEMLRKAEGKNERTKEAEAKEEYERSKELC